MKILSTLSHISTIFTFILTLLIAGFTYSWSSTGNIIQVFKGLSIHIWAICIALIIIRLLAIIINDRSKYIKKQNQSIPFTIAAIPINGWKDIGEIEYKGVIWKARVPKNHFSIPSYDEIDVDIPPRCPKCETKMEQSKSYFNWYIWKCVYCGFTKKNSASWYIESERAKKIAQREVEKLQSSSKQI